MNNRSNLFKLKSDCKDYLDIMDENGITCLYHFTDLVNLNSIKKYGGLLSWKDCEDQKIEIPKPGGNYRSRGIDLDKNLESYVHLSFCEDHPMKYSALRNGTIKDPRILKIDRIVVCWENTIYCNKNAADSSAILGNDLNYFKDIHFDEVKKSGKVTGMSKKYRQAEILALNIVPINLIDIPNG